MSEIAIVSDEPVTLLGAGPVDTQELAESLTYAPILVAADGGASMALSAGHKPDLVIGDLDSLTDHEQAQIAPDRIVQVDCQNSTDFDKCLARIQAPLILGIGFLGGRLDHHMASMSSLIKSPQTCVLVGPEDVICHAGRGLALDLEFGSRLSLFPMERLAGRSSGLEWPIEGLDFRPSGQIGTSNRVTGPVKMTFERDGMLLILPRGALGALLDGLAVRDAARAG